MGLDHNPATLRKAHDEWPSYDQAPNVSYFILFSNTSRLGKHFPLKPDDIAFIAVKFHADQVDFSVV